MNQSELKKIMHSFISSHFGSATVVWGKVKAVNSNAPQIVLTMGDIIRPYQPITQSINGVPINVYPSKTTLQVDIYTKGRPTSNESGVSASFENTAVNEMTEFANFLNSGYSDQWSSDNDVSILVNQVRDLTEIINDTSWEYRAMVELEIGFTQRAVGYAATMIDGGIPYHDNGIPKYDDEGYALDDTGDRLPGLPLPSDPDGNIIYPEPDNGSQDLANQSAGWFEQVVTNEQEE